MYKKLLYIFLLSFFYPQWAMWANPSLPVGNSDRGVGLGAGEIMLFADVNYQNFKWWHDIVPGAIISGTTSEELFEHKGQFNNKNLNLGFTIGINDYLSLYLHLVKQAIHATEERASHLLQGQNCYMRFRADKDPARGMLTRIYGKEWTESYIHDVLFDL